MYENTVDLNRVPSSIRTEAESEAWRAEVDQIISRISERSQGSLAKDHSNCTATLVIPAATQAWHEAWNTEATEADVSTPTRMKIVPQSPMYPGEGDITSPAHPAALESLRSACMCVEPDSSLIQEVMDAAKTVHACLGPGLQESIYVQCLVQELEIRGRQVERSVPVSVAYKGEVYENAFHLTLRVESTLIVEVKAVDRILASDEAILRNHLIRSGAASALLINFNESELSAGMRTIDSTQ